MATTNFVDYTTVIEAGWLNDVDAMAYSPALIALATYDTNGLVTQTATGTMTGRTITGTADRVSITNGNGVAGNPTVDIASTYVGQTSITTTGVISTGAWNGTTIGETVGGTGNTTYTQGDIIYCSSLNTLSKLAKNTSSTRYLSNTGTSNNPAWAQIGLTTGVTGVLPVANGGTNASTASITSFNNITGYTAAGATGTTSTNLVFSTSPTLTTPLLGTPTSGTLTNCTGLPMTTGVTGVLPVANGGTNASTASITAFNNITGYTAAGATGTTSTNLVFSTSPTLTTPILGTPTSGTLTNCTGLPVAGAGTGRASHTAYAVICGGTSTTAAQQSIASVGTAGQVLTSNGASNLPTFGSVINSVTKQIFTANGTYTPTSGMVYCVVEGCGGGGGSGGCTGQTAPTPAASATAGGGGGSYARVVLTAAQIGASKAVTIGAAGTAGASGANNGGAGGTTSLGTLLSAGGGSGSLAKAFDVSGFTTATTAGGTATVGDVLVGGGTGSAAAVQQAAAVAFGFAGTGGSSILGVGGAQQVNTNTATLTGNVGTGYGAGAGGSMTYNTASSVAGAAGTQGIIIITEYIGA